MRKPNVLITAAAGKTGFAAALQLLAQGYPVRAFVRQADQRSETLRRQGAEIFIGDLADIVDVRRGLEGMQRAYFCPPWTPGSLAVSATFAAAAQERKLEVVVALSQWLADPSHYSTQTRASWLSEKIFSWMPDVETVTVNPGWFADNYMAVIETSAQLGIMPMPLGQGLNAPPSNEDIARVIVGALSNPAPHLGKTYRPTGPRLLSPEDIAATFGKVLGRTVTYQDAPLKLFLKVAKSLGFPVFQIAQIESYLQEYQKNAFGKGAPTEAVLEVGGCPPEDFETIVRRYVASSPSTRRTLSARARALLGLVKALGTPAPNLQAFARAHDFRQLAHLSFAVDSAEWQATHKWGSAVSPRDTSKDYDGADEISSIRG